MDARVSIRRTGAWLTVLAVVGTMLFAVSDTAEAQAAVFIQRLDHFRCYNVVEADPAIANTAVFTQDQFNIPDQEFVELFVANPVWFCNPTRKIHGDREWGIGNPDGHLKFYLVDPIGHQDPLRRIKYRNQFGGGQAVLGQTVLLGVPTQKEGHEPPKRLDHFKCYEVLEAKPADAFVTLGDQWTSSEAEVGHAIVFCNPTRKIDAAGNAVGVSNPGGHLMCYEASRVDITATVFTHNQFGEELLVVDGSDVLCVPTRKSPKFEVL